MTEVKTIKDVDDATWAEFKSLSSKNQVKMGIFFKTLLQEYEKTTRTFWKDILEGEKILTNAEATEIEDFVKYMRKEHGFRK